VQAEREPDLLDRAQLVRDCVEPGVESARSLGHRLVEQVLLRVDVGVQRALLHPQRLRDLADRRAVIALLREEARGLASQLVATGAHRSR
jgi:hypothetical protein